MQPRESRLALAPPAWQVRVTLTSFLKWAQPNIHFKRFCLPLVGCRLANGACYTCLCWFHFDIKGSYAKICVRPVAVPDLSGSLLLTTRWSSSLLLLKPCLRLLLFRAYTINTLKHHSCYEVMLPLFSPVLLFVLCTVWIFLSPSDILQAHPRLFYFMVGTAFANISVSPFSPLLHQGAQISGEALAHHPSSVPHLLRRKALRPGRK